MADVQFDDAAAREWLLSPDGPLLGGLLPRIGKLVAAGARRRCPRRTGETADSISYATGSDGVTPYVDIGADYIAFFLQKPAEQMHRAQRFLTDSITDANGAL